jgi:outer membrane immunogenic protein
VFGLFTGQIGFAANNFLVYLKGGAAVVSDRYSSFTTTTNVLVSSTSDGSRWGGTVGVGLEYGFARNWSFAIEYDHIFLQTNSYTFLNNGNTGAAGTLFGNDRIRQDVDLVTARINYHFNMPLVAKY